jgi:glc operon protein GlcG
MTRNAVIIGVSTVIVAYAASAAQTIQVSTLDEAGAERVLQVAKENARKRNAPSAIAVVDPAGDLLAFERMNDVRPASAELAIDKARTAARLQRPTEEVEDSINRGRTELLLRLALCRCAAECLFS